MMPLSRSLSRIALATINGYPVVLEYNLGYKSLVDAALSIYERKIRRLKSVATATTYKPLDVVHLKITTVAPTMNNQVLKFDYGVSDEDVPTSIEGLAGSIYIPSTLLDKRSVKRFRLKMPLKPALV
nr:hypothetical protein [Desulforamulus aquiferis]